MGSSLWFTGVRDVGSSPGFLTQVRVGSPHGFATPTVTYNRGVESTALAAIAAKYGIALIIRFGSTVSGQTHAHSDVDLGVLFDGMPSLDDELAVAADLRDIASARPVDMAVLNRADPLLLKLVAAAGRLEYGDPARFEAFCRYAFKRYHDHRPYFDMERDYVARVFAQSHG